MSNFKFAAGVVLAGALAFGGVFAAQAITAPMLHGIPSESSSGEDEPTEENDVNDNLEAELIGRWRAPQPANQDAFVEFNNYGLWTASDGCNGAAGDWTVEPDGSFDGGEGGAMTLIACDNVAIPSTLWATEHVEVTANDELILTTKDGEEMVLMRDSATAFTLVGTWVSQSTKANQKSSVEFTSDGKWVGTVGCASFNGTWMLGVRNVPVIEDEGTEPSAPILLSGPGSLMIGPKPAEEGDDQGSDSGASCADAPDEFVLSYDTEYVFYINEDGSFELGSTAPGEVPDPKALLFERA